MIKPKIVLSRCFNEPVRYNGGKIDNNFINILKKYIEYIDFCPEVDIGLGVPRKRLMIIKDNSSKRLVQEETGFDLTEKMKEYCEMVSNSIKDVDGFILKAKSPSCGVGTANLYKNNSIIGRTYGFFAEKIKEKFPYLPIEDEKRLLNKDLREHFLIRIFAFANLKELINNPQQKNLIEFHKNYKYLLMTYNQKILKELGQIVASKIPIEEKITKYKDKFYQAFSKKPSIRRHFNTLLHIFGHIKDRLNLKERKHLQNLIEDYGKGKIEIRVIIELFKNLSYRFGNDYLIYQKYLQPYPDELNI